MTSEERTAKITSIIRNMKYGERKLFQCGVEVWCDYYDDVMGWRYSVIAPDGDTCQSGISRQTAINIVVGSYPN